MRLFQIMDGRRRRGEGGGGITCSSEAVAAGGGGGEERMEGYANRAQLSQGSRARKRKEGRPISDEREAEVEAAGDPRERENREEERKGIHPSNPLFGLTCSFFSRVLPSSV